MSATRRIVGVAACAVLIAAVSTASAASYAELLAKAKAARAHATKSGKTLVPAEPPAEAYKPTAADKERGLVVYAPPIAEPFTDRPPAAAEVREAVEVRMAPGETESLLLAVHALRPQMGLTLSAAVPADFLPPLDSRKRLPSSAAVTAKHFRAEFLPVVMAPLAQRRSDRYRVVGLWLADGGAVDIEPGHSRAWVVRLRLPDDAKPGNYVLTPLLLPKLGEPVSAGPKIRLQVLPFRLADPWKREYVFGTFCGGADFSEAQYAEMKAHGIETILWFWGHYGLDVHNDGGKLRMDFAALDRTVSRFQKAGLRGPIALALGNDSCGHFERAICRAFDLPMQPRAQRRRKTVQVAVLDNPRIEALMVEALRQLFVHAKAKKWPEIVILPYDEPTERLMNEHRRMVRLFRKHFPKVRLYGVTMDRLKLAEMVLDTDILVSNGDFARIRKLATERSKSAWFYGSVTTAHGYAGCRWRYGLRTYAYGPDGMWFWCYNFHVGDPWNEFDSFTPDSSWVICWPPLKAGAASIETLAYEGLREAVDDCRYAMTLEALLAKAAPSAAAKSIQADYDRWRKGLQGARPTPSQIVRHREKLIEWLLALRGSRK